MIELTRAEVGTVLTMLGELEQVPPMWPFSDATYEGEKAALRERLTEALSSPLPDATTGPSDLSGEARLDPVAASRLPSSGLLVALTVKAATDAAVVEAVRDYPCDGWLSKIWALGNIAQDANRRVEACCQSCGAGPDDECQPDCDPPLRTVGG